MVVDKISEAEDYIYERAEEGRRKVKAERKRKEMLVEDAKRKKREEEGLGGGEEFVVGQFLKGGGNVGKVKQVGNLYAGGNDVLGDMGGDVVMPPKKKKKAGGFGNFSGW